MQQQQLAVKIKKNYRTEKSANCEAKNTRGNKKSFVVVDNSSPFPTKDAQQLQKLIGRVGYCITSVSFYIS